MLVFKPVLQMYGFDFSCTHNRDTGIYTEVTSSARCVTLLFLNVTDNQREHS